MPIYLRGNIGALSRESDLPHPIERNRLISLDTLKAPIALIESFADLFE